MNEHLEVEKLIFTKDNDELARRLSSGDIDVNMIFPYTGLSLLNTIIQDGTFEQFEMILTFQPDLEKIDQKGYNALSCAVHSGKTKIVETLLKKESKGINSSSSERTLPLHVSFFYGDAGIFKMLLDYGADPNIVNAMGDNLIDLMIKFDFYEMIPILDKYIESFTLENQKRYKTLRINKSVGL